MMIPPERYESLGELLADALIQFKSETALVEHSRKRVAARYSYLEVKRAAELLARRLQAFGVDAGDRVAILMSNQSKWVISGIAGFLRGAVLVPLDYKLSATEQATLLAHCKPKVLITEYGIYRQLDGIEVPHALVSEAPDSALTAPGAERWEDAPAQLPALVTVPRRRSDQATLVYSSGTGGRPKGCMLSHDNYLEQYRSLSALYPFEIGDRYFSILPTNHAIDFMCGFVGPLCGGATIVHQRTLRPEMLVHTMKEEGVTHMAVVPLLLEAFERRIREKLEERSETTQSLFQMLKGVNAALTLRAPRQGLSRRMLRPVHDELGGALRVLFCGGAFVDPARAAFFYDLGVPVVIGYGLTEACTVLTVNDLRPFRADSVGPALDGVEIEVREQDPDTGIGEIWVRSRTVFMGYMDDPDQTAEVLVDGWLRTGDLGSLDASGHLRLVGRSKNMIVTAGGKNIYPEDVESAFEGVPCEELTVFASGYLFGGKLTEERLVAVVRGTEDGFRAELEARNRRLPEHKRLGGILELDEEFPRTASMKVKRAELRDVVRRQCTPDAIVPIGDASAGAAA